MPGGSDHLGWGRAAGEILLWWLITYAVWLATLSSFTASELVVAAACTLPCALVAPLARRANGGNWRFRSGWLRWLVIVARDVPVQTVEAWRYAVIPGRRRAVLTVVPLPTEDERAAAGRRAVSTLCFAITPGTVVCDSDARLDRVLLHRLGQAQGRLEGAVQR
jgi:multisubunit Na+/H+ antiporter MnhE subunit